MRQRPQWAHPGRAADWFRADPSQMIAYGQRRRLGAYAGARFPLPFMGLGCAGCKRPTLGGNTAQLTWYNGQVLTFNLDDPTQKAQYDAIRRQLTTQPGIEPTTTIVYGSSALIAPSPLPASYIPPAPVLVNASAAASASWLDRETIPGVKNQWLALGVGGAVLLASMRKGRR